MISKKDIIEIAHPDVKGTKVIELSTLRELHQQLKKELCNWEGECETRVHKCNTCIVIDGIIGVEGE